ncbi:MAG TPA: hypothetical protein VJP02_02895, partial [Candidatus Sulfotelmatobacter sp.]|nr:hypothetical protein [Candidatus Sulfotelmatobacter sp.]
QHRDNGRRPDRQAAPSEKARHTVQQQQLDYHRQQMAEENRRVAAPSGEPQKAGGVAALFGWVGRKVA